MPNHLKAIISAIAVLVGVLVFYLDTQAGHLGLARWVALALGPFAVVAIWIFPEAKAKEIRRDAAARPCRPASARS